jgi:hypothetical protein
MPNKKILKRIITCQGSIQLVTALSVLSFREKEQAELNVEYENYLVIHHLFSPPGQVHEFAAFIKKMAELICDWKAIVHISPEQMDTIFNKLHCTSPSKIFQRVYELVGTDSADEIYLATNWHSGNQILINAYQAAQKICYGDGIGIYISSQSKIFPTTNQPELNLYEYLKNKVRSTITNSKETLKENLNLKTSLKLIKFDIGYFFLPDVLGEVPPMKTVVLDRVLLLETLKKLKNLVDPDYITQFRERIADAPVSILLTSTFSEASRMSLEAELTAYRQFLIAEGIEQNAVLVVKPHPRDDKAKIQKLEHSLSDLFSKILILSELNLFFLPFEIFFMQAFLEQKSTDTNRLKLFALSSACLSLKLLFNVPSTVGFGDKITSSLFYEDYVSGRLEHELDLKTAIKKTEICVSSPSGFTE